MKRTISFGTIAYNSKKKWNEVTVDIELRKEGGDPIFTIDPQTKERVYTGEKTEEYEELSICGNIWNHLHTDIYCGGQCLDTIAEYIDTPLFKEIYRFWKLYHLNGMHTGTVSQENAIEEWKAEGHKYDYKEACEYLKSIGLYEVNYKGKPYKYGHAWLHWAIPYHDLVRIKEIIEKGE